MRMLQCCSMALLLIALLMLMPACSQPLPTYQPPIPAAPAPVTQAVLTDTDRYLVCVRPYGPDSIAFFTVSPDSNYVAVDARYTDSRTKLIGVACPPAADIFLINTDSMTVTPLTTDHISMSPCWSPNSNQLAFQQRGSIIIYIPVSQKFKRTTALTALLPQLPVCEFDYESWNYPKWSPNGQLLVAEGSNGGIHWLAVTNPFTGIMLFDSRKDVGDSIYCENANWYSDNSLGYERDGRKVRMPFAALVNK